MTFVQIFQLFCFGFVRFFFIAFAFFSCFYEFLRTFFVLIFQVQSCAYSIFLTMGATQNVAKIGYYYPQYYYLNPEKKFRILSQVLVKIFNVEIHTF